MSYTVTNLKNDIIGMLHGTTSNQINGFDNLINRAARTVLLDIDPQETIRIQQLDNTVFSGVYDYSVPTDLKGDRIIDIFPQVNRLPSEVFVNDYNQAFDIAKNVSFQDQMTVIFNTGLKSLRLSAPALTPGVIINQASSTTSNGTWVAGSTASNLSVNNINYVTGGGSLKFDLASGSGTQVGYLECTGMNSVDLGDVVNQATQFLYTYLPTASDFYSVGFLFGSDVANCYSLSTSTTQSGTTFQNGWNLLSYLWSSMTTVGSPDPNDITYARVVWTYNGTAQTGVLLNGISSSLGTILNIEYYSKYLFRNATTGAFQETVTDDSNIINLDVESYNILTYQCAYLAAQQQQGNNATQFDAPFHKKMYDDAVTRYKGLYKSQVQKKEGKYYVMPGRGYTRYVNVRFGQ